MKLYEQEGECMKRRLAILTALMLSVSLAACGSANGAPQASSDAESGVAQTTASSDALPTESADASGDAGGPGGPGGPGGGPGGASEPVDLSGLLSLDAYVTEVDGGTVFFDYYGVFTEASGDASFALSGEDPKEIKVYEDRDATKELDGVSASITDGSLVIDGLDDDANTVCYLKTDAGDDVTVVYAVGDEVDATYEQKLEDGKSIMLSDYAPKNETSKVYIGGNQQLFDVDDFEDLSDLSEEEKEIAQWWLHSGITNSGQTMDKFGEQMYRFELSVTAYRFFQIVNDINTTTDGFVDPEDSVGVMFGNDQYSDSVSANLYSGIFDGLYTTKNGKGDLENIDGVTTIGADQAVDEEYVMTILYNAVRSPFSSLNEEGEKLAAQLTDSGAETGEEKTKALEEALDFTYGTYSTDKLNAIAAIRALEPYVEQKDSPDASFQDKVQTEPTSDVSEIIGQISVNTVTDTTDFTDTSLATDETTALFVNNAQVNLKNTFLTSSGDTTHAYEILGISAGMPAMPTLGHNMTFANANYRSGVGAVITAWGHDTVINLSNDTGELLIEAPQGSASMAGGLYNGFGASYYVDGGVVMSNGQHMSNTVYNGTIHYDGTEVINPNGRQFSSDFWGGYIVFDNAVAEGGFVTDEPTTVINKNAVLKYGNGGSINGYGSMYYENSVIEDGGFTFQNNTSLITDAGSLILVNSEFNGESLGTVTRSEKAVIRLVDSVLNLTSGNILSIDDTLGSPISMDDATFHEMFAGQARIEIYGDVTINVPEKAGFTVTSEDGEEEIIVYASQIDGDLDDSNITVVLDDAYGVLHIVQK